jgi:hypothetical protein
MSAAFSPIMMQARLGLPRGRAGITEASATRRPSIPRTAQRRVDHGIVIDPHPARAGRMRPMGRVRANVFRQLRIALKLGAGQVLARDQLAQRTLRVDAAAEAHGLDHAVEIAGLGEHVEEDARRIAWIGRAQPYPTARLQRQIASAD